MEIKYTLHYLLQGISPLQCLGNLDIPIAKICFDSRQVSQHDVFVALKGTNIDGHQFISIAIQKGAKAIILEEMPTSWEHEGVTCIQVKDSAHTLGIMATHYYCHPSQKLKLVGITGTNGKTTTATLLFKLFRGLGYNVGLISTVQNQINETVIPSTHTTPDPLQLNALLAQMQEAKCTHVFMEVSSHAAHQKRIAGLQFAGAVFTNITHDHLDYHKTFDEYIKAKKSFFDGLSKNAFALVNKDDKRGMVMLQNTLASKYTFAMHSMADFRAKVMENSVEGLHLHIDEKEVWFKLIGDFNAYNLLGVYATAVLLGEKKEEILTVLSDLSGAVGRFDRVESPDKVWAIVDYAHTPDALENVLKTIQDLRTGNQKIITVVGCGGNRDATKRPIMAKIATQYSDAVILTSDNPRFESPETIIEDMRNGLSPNDLKKTKCITDRRNAIYEAYRMTYPEDIILVAGKGHENYQEIEGVKHHFDDKEVIEDAFRLNTRHFFDA